MLELFPEPICKLPQADLPFKGSRGYISQAQNHQILFMEFSEDVEVPEHHHASQWGIVLEGRIDLNIDNVVHTFTKGDRYFIPRGIHHSARIHAGYADITFFNQADRYSVKAK